MTQSLAFKMAIRPFGDSALLVDIDAGSSDASSDIVMALDSQILRQRTRGITQTTPSYNSLLICFEPEQVQHSVLQAEIHAIADTIDIKDIPKGNQWSLPACFDAPYALDCAALETELSQDWQSIIDCFCAAEYRVHAIGFLPGFTYLGIFQTHCTATVCGIREQCACVIDCHCRHSSRHLSLRLAGRMADHRSTALHCLPNSG